jgi:dienelactone hydrolase
MRTFVSLMVLATAALPLVANAVQAQGNVDPRIARVRTNKEGNDFAPPPTREAWLARREQVRNRILVSCGLYPLPERTPLNPKVYGKVERDGYTVEKVVLETMPGFYLSGNLYRPTRIQGTVPGILNPHGHWQEGRVAGDLQARCIGQARMGAVAFLYDMVGYMDSKPFGHAFMDDELAARGMNLTGLQLWNSIRALDWLLSLPEVDSNRIGCTGESGGGTQTFLLSAVDDRIQVSAPVCMISHHFQGGCTCENAPNLRVGTDNVEFAALFAPKPQLIVGATGDWTSQIQERGVPEIRAVYKLFDAEHNLLSVVHDAGHNYNQASRESVYTFFRRHLWGEKNPQPVKEAAFTPEEEKAITTWDASNPRPASAVSPAELKRYLNGVVAGQISSFRPTTDGQWRWSRNILRTALETLLDSAPLKGDTLVYEVAETLASPGLGYRKSRVLLSRKDEPEQTTVTLLVPDKKGNPGTITVVVHPKGSSASLASDGVPSELVAGLLRKGQGVVLVEPFLAEKHDEIVKRQSAEFFTTYNRTVLADRVRDVIHACGYAHKIARNVNLVGLETAGPWVLLAKPFAGGINRTAADAAEWEWTPTIASNDPMALPGALRYGGLKAFACLDAPDPLFLYNYGTALDTSWLRDAYRIQDSKALRLQPGRATQEALVSWLAGEK